MYLLELPKVMKFTKGMLGVVYIVAAAELNTMQFAGYVL